MSLTTIVEFAAPALTVYGALTQAQRIQRRGARGVSVHTWLLAAFVSELWLCYGLVFRVPNEVWTNVPSLVLAAIIGLSAARHQQRLTRSVGLLVTYSLATAVVTVASADARWFLASVAVVGCMVMYLPQVHLAFTHEDLSGVALPTYYIAIVTMTCWLLYGLGIHQPPIYLPTFVMIPSSVLIIMKTRRRRRAVISSPSGTTVRPR